MPIAMHGDLKAAIGIAGRKGPGEIRPLDVTDLCIQDKMRGEQIRLLKILGADDVADLFTKYVDRSTLENRKGPESHKSYQARRTTYPRTGCRSLE